MDCSRASEAERVFDWGEAVQCPKERKPIFFIAMPHADDPDAVAEEPTGHRLLFPSNVSIPYMSWRKDEPGEAEAPRGYHHGNLREALIRAALELIAKKGAAGFTFAEAARFAGVSPAAPYRHFRDREELLANVALRGFEQFEAALARAWDEGRPDPFAALHQLGKAYLEFARTQPAFYSAMFEAGIPVEIGRAHV